MITASNLLVLTEISQTKNWNPPFNDLDRQEEMQCMLRIWAWIVSLKIICLSKEP